MTSFAFISHSTLSVLALAIAQGPGAELRQVLGTAVFTGMLGVTVFGLFLTPVFYVLLRGLSQRFWSGGVERHHQHHGAKKVSPVAHTQIADREIVTTEVQPVM